MKRNAITYLAGIGAGVVGFVSSGCQHAPATAGGGVGNFTFIEPPAAAPTNAEIGVPTGPRQPVDVLLRAEPIEPLAKPEYPRTVKGAGRVPMLVGVRLTVDASGRVSHVGTSMRAISTPGVQAAEFFAAVEEAVAQWRFKPAEQRHMVPGTNDVRREHYWLITRTEKTEDAFDVVFTFSASGDVTSGWAK